MLTNSIGFTLIDITRFFRHNFEELLKHAGLNLSVGEIRALDVVTTSGAQRQNVLAATLGVEPMTMSAYLDRLAIQGLIVRLPDPTDRRAKIVKATDAGSELGSRLSGLTKAMNTQLTTGIGVSDLHTIERAILKMRINLLTTTDAGESKSQITLAA